MSATDSGTWRSGASLPAGWIEASLDEIAEVRLGRQRSPKNHTGVRMRPYLRAANVTWNGLELSDVKEMNFTDAESEVYELRAGDVVIAEASGSASEVGKPAIWRGEIEGCCFQNTLIRLRSHHALPEFLRYFVLLEARSGRIGNAAPGVGIHHIGSTRLAAWPVPVPPLNEQRRIVAAIEEQLSRIDAADASLAAARTRFATLRPEVVRQGLEGEWTELQIDEVADVISGPAFKSASFGGPGEGIRLLRGENIEPASLRWRDTRTWPTSRLSGHEHLLVEERDLILAMDRPVISTGLKLAPVRRDDLPALLVQRVARLRPRDLIESRFLHLCLQLPRFIPHVLGDQTGTQIPHITLAGIRAFVVPVPPLHEQRRIVGRIEEQLSVVDALRAAIERAQRRSASLRRAVLDRAFRGELVPQDPTDEPADTVLARIRAERETNPRPSRRRRVSA